MHSNFKAARVGTAAYQSGIYATLESVQLKLILKYSSCLTQFQADGTNTTFHSNDRTAIVKNAECRSSTIVQLCI